MNLTQFSDHLSFSFAILELGLVKPYAYVGKTSIWINGQSHSGKPKTVILGLSRCTLGYMKAYVCLTDQGKVRYSSQHSTNHSNISIQEAVTLWTKLIGKLSKEHLMEQENLKCITGDHIGHQPML